MTSSGGVCSKWKIAGVGLERNGCNPEVEASLGYELGGVVVLMAEEAELGGGNWFVTLNLLDAIALVDPDGGTVTDGDRV